MKNREEINRLSGVILDAAIRVHKEMGPGLLESIYQHCLFKELSLRGVDVKTMVQVPLCYRGDPLDKKYIIDILVEDDIIVELKAVDAMSPVYEAQILSYLKLSGKRLGLLINFNVVLFKDGFKRFVNKL